jgi:hypothetical protein
MLRNGVQPGRKRFFWIIAVTGTMQRNQYFLHDIIGNLVLPETPKDIASQDHRNACKQLGVRRLVAALCTPHQLG